MLNPFRLSSVISLSLFALLLINVEAAHSQSSIVSTDTITVSSTIANGVEAENIAGASSVDEITCPPTNKTASKVTGVRLLEIQRSDNAQVEGEGNQFDPDELGEVKLGDYITLQVENLTTLYAEAECEKKDIVLYLNGRPLADTTPYPPSDPKSAMLNFPLDRTENSNDVWSQILGKKKLRNNFAFSRQNQTENMPRKDELNS